MSTFKDPRTGKNPYTIPALPVAGVVVFGLIQAAALVGYIISVHQLLNAISPQWVGAQAQANWQAGLQALVWLVISILVAAISRGFSFAISERAGYEVVRQLRISQYRHLQGMNSRQLQHRARGGLLLRFTGDLGMLRNWISRGLLEGSVNLLVVLTGIAILFWLDPLLGMGVTGSILVVSALGLAGGRSMRRSIRTMRRHRSLLTGNIDEQLNALSVVQGFDRLRGEEERLSQQNDAMTRSLIGVSNRRGYWRALTALGGMLPIAVVLLIALVQVPNQQMSLATMVSGVLVAQYLARPVRMVGLAHDHWHRSRVSEGKIRDFLASSSQPLDEDKPALIVRGGRIDFHGATVDNALHELTASIEPGQFVALTGPAGAGKSTILQLISGLATVDGGSMEIDGQDVEQVNLRSRLGRAAIISPDLPLMRGTILRNITYARPASDNSEVHRVVLGSGLDEVLRRLPEGINTWLTEGGKNLSRGERQQVAWARALMANPKILLLDEPSDGLDGQTAAVLRRMLRNHAGTIVMATDDPADLALADVIWHLQDGVVTRVQTNDDYKNDQWEATRVLTRVGGQA